MYGRRALTRLFAGGFFRIVQRRLLRRMCREEAREVVVLVVRQRNEAEVGELELARFRNQHFGRDLGLVTGAEVVQVDRQIFDQTACLRDRGSARTSRS